MPDNGGTNLPFDKEESPEQWFEFPDVEDPFFTVTISEDKIAVLCVQPLC